MGPGDSMVPVMSRADKEDYVSGWMQWSRVREGRRREKWGRLGAGAGRFRGGRGPKWGRARKEAGRSRGLGMVPGRVLGGKEGEPRVREARRVLGGPGAGAKRVPLVGRRSRGGG